MCHTITKTERDQLMFSCNTKHLKDLGAAAAPAAAVVQDTGSTGFAAAGARRMAAAADAASEFSWALRKAAASGTQADRTSLRVLGEALKVSKVSHRIRKPSLPLPAIQLKPPVIIHTYSPKIIHTEPESFMSLVQKLTGSSDTRLRHLNADRGSSTASCKPLVLDPEDNDHDALRQLLLAQQENETHDAEGIQSTTRQQLQELQSELRQAAATGRSDCFSSPSSSSEADEYSRFASSTGGVVTAKKNMKLQYDDTSRSTSPKSPLPSCSYGSAAGQLQDLGQELLNSSVFFSAGAFDQQAVPLTCGIKSEPADLLSPIFSFSDLTFLAAEVPGTFDAAARTSCCSTSSSTSRLMGSQRSQQLHEHQDQMMSFSGSAAFRGAASQALNPSYIDVSYPNFASTSGNYLSPGLSCTAGDCMMIHFPALTPSCNAAMWSPSFLDCLNTTTTTTSSCCISPAALTPLPFITHSASPSYSPAAGTPSTNNNIVSLRDIQAMNDVELLRGF
ncbi:unnamed protein product [Sphagnum troendelagicum]|uniref:VQ domain-containing protein n=1 Tax=Sphagnum troendelagicum TaxID=128251 RepID=A0ABP0THB1_9BRYO